MLLPPQTAQQATHCARALMALSRLFNVLLPPVDGEGPLEMAFSASVTRKSALVAPVPVVPNRQMRRKAEALARR